MVLAPQLQQSLALLQAPTLELKALVEQELQQNPVLEEVIGETSEVSEKLGEEDKLWEQIAPWVNDGSYIQCHGEDSAYWRWAFREGKFFFVEAQLHWDDPIDCGYRYQDPNICGDEVAAARRAVGWDGGLALEQLVLGTEDIVVRTEENEHGTQYAIQALRTKGTT